MSVLSIQELPNSVNLVGLLVMAGNSSPSSLKTNLSATSDPTASNDGTQGYSVGSFWINTMDQGIFFCAFNGTGAAVWQRCDNSNSTQSSISQTISGTNTFAAANVVRKNFSAYALAQGDTDAHAYGTVGVIQQASGSAFTVVYSGVCTISSHGFTPGSLLYLSAATAGLLTATAPNRKILVAIALDVNNLFIYPQGQASTFPGINNYASDTGTANAYAVALPTAPSAYEAGMQLSFLAVNANTGASTINVNSLGVKNITKYGVNALTGGEINASQVIDIIYDGTEFQLVNGVNLLVGNGLKTDSTLGLVQNYGINAQSGTSYAIISTDRAKLVSSNNASAVAWSLPIATTFGAGFFFYAKNLSSGAVTITPTTSTINGSATLVLAQNESYQIISDGTNYQAFFTSASNPVSFKSITTQKFTASGTYTPNAHLMYAQIQVIGAGGSGAGSSSSTGNGGGGGSGEAGFAIIASGTVGSSQTVTIGSGGSGIASNTNASGNAGGTSSVGTLCSGAGGTGGTSGNTGGAGGAGGTGGSSGGWHFPGSPGANGASSIASVAINSEGGGSGGGNFGGSGVANSGGGGGGGSISLGSGQGGSGIIIITEYNSA